MCRMWHEQQQLRSGRCQAGDRMRLDLAVGKRAAPEPGCRFKPVRDGRGGSRRRLRVPVLAALLPSKHGDIEVSDTFLDDLHNIEVLAPGASDMRMGLRHIAVILRIFDFAV